MGEYLIFVELALIFAASKINAMQVETNKLNVTGPIKPFPSMPGINNNIVNINRILK